MKVLITGATGLVGNEIVAQCHQKGYVVHYLTTRKSKIKTTENYKGFYWNPAKNDIDANCLNGIDAIINLAGATVSKRWTKAYKQLMYDSRILSVKLLHKLLSENEHTVKHFCSASAIGIYPPSLTAQYDESETTISDGFLGNLVATWENEMSTIESLGIKVAKIRIGVVLSNNGGALVKIMEPISKGFGSPLGSGKQFMSWIHINDVAKMFLFIIENKLSGIFNAVADTPVTNTEITHAIAKKINRKIWLPKVPAFVLKLALGEMSTLVLESQFVKNDKIKQEGFQFEFENIDVALSKSL